MVLVSMGMDQDDLMVAEESFNERRSQHCFHGFLGFSCKECLQRDAGLPVTKKQTKVINRAGQFDRTTFDGAKDWADHLSTIGPEMVVTKEKHRLGDGMEVFLVRQAA